MSNCTSIGMPISIDTDVIYKDENCELIIDKDINVGNEVIKITAQSILIKSGVTITARTIELSAHKHVYCLGNINCGTLAIYALHHYVRPQNNPIENLSITKRNIGE